MYVAEHFDRSASNFVPNLKKPKVVCCREFCHNQPHISPCANIIQLKGVAESFAWSTSNCALKMIKPNCVCCRSCCHDQPQISPSLNMIQPERVGNMCVAESFAWSATNFSQNTIHTYSLKACILQKVLLWSVSIFVPNTVLPEGLYCRMFCHDQPQFLL